jgi:hypothetical protein
MKGKLYYSEGCETLEGQIIAWIIYIYSKNDDVSDVEKKNSDSASKEQQGTSLVS